jgi:hypothetical protein
MGIERRVSVRLERLAHGLVSTLLPGGKPELSAALESSAAAKEDEALKRVSEIASAKVSESEALDAHGLRVVVLVARDIEQSLHEEKRAAAKDAFTTGSVPQIALEVFFARLARYTNMWRGHAGGPESAGVRAAVIALIYLDRLRDSGYVVSWANVHRLAVAAFLVAIKYSEDSVISNTWWAKVGGVPLKELCALESQLCDKLHFSFFVDAELYSQTLQSHDNF